MRAHQPIPSQTRGIESGPNLSEPVAMVALTEGAPREPGVHFDTPVLRGTNLLCGLLPPFRLDSSVSDSDAEATGPNCDPLIV